MKRTRKYPKTSGYFVYAHITPEKEVYIGMSKQQPHQRWQPSHYNNNSLTSYIKRFGWENIEHRVLVDRLSKEQAYQVEDWFIKNATADGFCINKHRSGGLCCNHNYKSYNDARKEKRKVYMKAYREAHKEEQKAYVEANKEVIREKKKVYMKAYREAHKEEQRSYDKQRLSTPEGKIYSRVKNYNYYHQDKVIETPLEAKQKYLNWGYIPDYIKNDDLF